MCTIVHNNKAARGGGYVSDASPLPGGRRVV